MPVLVAFLFRIRCLVPSSVLQAVASLKIFPKQILYLHSLQLLGFLQFEQLDSFITLVFVHCLNRFVLLTNASQSISKSHLHCICNCPAFYIFLNKILRVAKVAWVFLPPEGDYYVGSGLLLGSV